MTHNYHSAQPKLSSIINNSNNPFEFDYGNIRENRHLGDVERKEKVFQLLWMLQSESDWFYGFDFDEINHLVDYVNLAVIPSNGVVLPPQCTPSWFGLICTGTLVERQQSKVSAPSLSPPTKSTSSLS